MSKRITMSDRARAKLATSVYPEVVISIFVPIKTTAYAKLRSAARRHKMSIPEYTMIILERAIIKTEKENAKANGTEN